MRIKDSTAPGDKRMSTWQEHPWMGVFAATLCPFHKDESLDEEGLRAYIRELAAVPGLKGLVPNGHTGEIMSLREAERAEVTRIVAEEVSGFSRATGARAPDEAGVRHEHRTSNIERPTSNGEFRTSKFDVQCSMFDVPGVSDHVGSQLRSLNPETRNLDVSSALRENVPLTRTPENSSRLMVISGVCGEGSLSATDHAIAAKEAGADGILLMPPHHWLRFGRTSAEAVGFIADVAEGADIDIVIHQYPAWTKAGYSLKEMLEMVKIPQVKVIKMGTRDMARWLWDYEQLKAARPDLSIITCHDEYLLPTLLEAGDGALIGFAGFAPELMIELVHACLEGDLARAKKAQQTVAPLARLIYNFGEPGCGAHQRMKVAKWLLGEISSPVFRRPVRPLPETEVQRLREGLHALGLRTNG
jgi:4-hydroxy-tetrahydrodipicolinate synthase